jgi:monothiol glutaredoxin
MVPIRATQAVHAMTPTITIAAGSGGQEPLMSVTDRIKAVVEDHPIVLFMKGTPQFPMCGFSSRAVQVLRECGADFKHVNVLEDPEIRATLPRYSDWPTFPQLFINGELIGGCDITVELHQQGELALIVAEAQKVD